MRTATSLPDEQTRKAAREASAALKPLLARKVTRIRLVRAKNSVVEITLPHTAALILGDALQQLAAGNAVTLVPTNAELTTQQAADMLNVSRPFLIGLVKQGEIPHRMVGNRRKVRAADVFAYRAKMDKNTRAALADLTAEAEALGLDY